MDVYTAVQWIHNRKKFAEKPGLLRVHHLLYLLGNPERNVRAIHIAGTNGKGSTVAYLCHLFRQAGYTVGTFTSPYIRNFNERIRLNGTSISDTDLIALIQMIRPLVEEMDQDPELEGITEFEIITAMMFYYFAQKQPDVAIIEVGLGGMYDSTNVITNPLVTAISTIGYDHVDILGDTIAAIAQQKAGIFKPNVPVVLGNLPEEAKQVCIEYANTLQCPVYSFGEDYEVKYLGRSQKRIGEKFNFKDDLRHAKRLVTPLIGQHQVENAAFALQIFDVIAKRDKIRLSTSDIQHAFNNVKWPGRMEIFQQQPLIILDGAHNEPAMECLVNNLKTEYNQYHVNVLFAAIQGKNYDAMIHRLEGMENVDLTLATFDSPKSLTCEQLSAYENDAHVTISTNWRKSFFEMLKNTDDDDMIVATGSLYFVSEVRDFLMGSSDDYDE